MGYVMKVAKVPAAPPGPAWAAQMTHRLMAAEGDLDRRILGALVARPKRFRELKPLLGERTEANLTHALRRLTRDGLIVQRAVSWEELDTRVHQLTPLGASVLYHIIQYQAFDAVIAARDDAAASA